MSLTMDDSIKRWTAKRKTALVVEIIQGKTTVAEASRAHAHYKIRIETGMTACYPGDRMDAPLALLLAVAVKLAVSDRWMPAARLDRVSCSEAIIVSKRDVQVQADV